MPDRNDPTAPSGERLPQQRTRRLPPHAGLKNSSVTRVRPFFCRLLDRDPTGESWLPDLLSAAPGAYLVPAGIRARPGALDQQVLKRCGLPVPALERVISLERCFEYPAPPPTAFLRWLLMRPDVLRENWPNRRDGAPKRYGERTQRLREELVGDDPVRQAGVQAEGLDELAKRGGRGSSKKWWAFEGFTEVDCALVTDRLLLFIEGKRTEPISTSTDWYPKRSQLLRNIEAVQEIAEGRSAAVLLVTEDPLRGEVDQEVVAASLPHLDPAARVALMRHYLGQTTWRALGARLDIPFETLPETKHEALRDLEGQGRVLGPVPARP